ncbi:MaoC family dehydratase [Nocardia sp. NPDC004340]
MIVLHGADEVRAYVGRELGASAWVEISQAVIDRFAEITGDDQWIHTDPVRAGESELGSTIAHGCYLLSLAPRWAYEMFALEGFAYVLNVGYNTVRFTAPVPAGSRVRMLATLSRADQCVGGLQLTITQKFEVEGIQRPVCMAQSVVRALHAPEPEQP